MKHIIVACGTGVATSTAVGAKVERLCKERGIAVTVESTDFHSLTLPLRGCDLFVSIIPLDKKDYGVPTVSGIPFLTGVGLDSAMEQVSRILKGK